MTRWYRLVDVPVAESVVTDLDQPQAVTTGRRPKLRTLAPWALSSALAVALAAMLLPKAPAQPQPTRVDPQIATWSSDGPNGNTWVHRDRDGFIAAVVTVAHPFTDEEVWCSITANNVVVEEQHETGGASAVCVWFAP